MLFKKKKINSSMFSHPYNIILRRTSIFSGNLKPSQNTQFISTLCSSTQSLSQTIQSHAIALIHGYLPTSISISASLILQYSTFKEISTSQILFHQSLPYSKSAFLWNTITRAHTIGGVYDRFEIYNLMIRTGVKPDNHTFPFVLKVCSDYREVNKGKEIHGSVYKSGFGSDLFVGNTLLRFYGECEDFSDAQKVFDEMPERDVVSWNTLISTFSDGGSFTLFKEMISSPITSSRIKPNMVTIVSLLPVCAATNECTLTSELHCYVVKMGFDSRIMINNALIDAYGKCGYLGGCKQVFDEMVERNDVSWNVVITSLASMDRLRDSVDFFRFMIGKGVKPNHVAISSMLPILIELECVRLGIEVHGYSIRNGLECDLFVANSLLDMYAKSGYPIKACKVFDKIRPKNVVTWNALIANYAQNGLEPLAFRAVIEMQNRGQCPGEITLTNVLPACARIGSLFYGKQVHSRTIRCGFSDQSFVSNALIDMYSKCGRLDLASKVFDGSYKDKISYNILISSFSRSNTSFKSLILFQEMLSKGFEIDSISVSGALSACANMAETERGKEIHGVCVRNLFESNLVVSNSILDLYSKSGNLDLAKKVFDRTLIKDAASWNTIIMGYGIFGEFETAISLFESMKCDEDVECDPITFIAVLTVCSHGGLVETGKRYFKEMKDEHGIEPTRTHYGCMVDLLGRAGLMSEAVEMINGLVVEPDANIWASLVGACRIHGDMELGFWAGENLVRLKPDHSGHYTLVSNMYSEAGKWNEADRVRELMKVRGVKKNPGFSWASDDPVSKANSVSWHV